jgi:cytoskeletal protein CcmA (bactofilin family)
LHTHLSKLNPTLKKIPINSERFKKQRVSFSYKSSTMSGKIFIPKPCHENWNNMSPQEKGRHCAVCSKVVKDFTTMKTNEIIDVLKETEGEVCGRINVKEITPTNKKQKVYFLINGWLYRKAIYPVMALLGFTLVSKKISAQTDYPLKGKVAYTDYHTSSKKIVVIIKSEIGNRTISDAHINIVSGLTRLGKKEELITDTNGKVTFNIEAEHLVSDAIEIEIIAPGFETKRSTIKIIKDVQTVEIRMEEDMMIMGEMMYMPEKEIKPDVIEKNNVRDSSKKIQVTKCSILEVKELPLINAEVLNFEPAFIENTGQVDSISNIRETGNTVSATFNIYPVPASDFVNVTSNGAENFNLDLLDANGKKIQSVINGNGRCTLDVTSYANGIYYVVITVGNKAVETKKILVSR